MTKVLSFAEWLAQQKQTDICDAHEGCEQWVCALMDEPKCKDEEVDTCPIKRAYERQRDTDLQRWEKWNAKV